MTSVPPPNILVDAVLYPKTNRRSQITLSMMREWRHAQGLTFQDVVKSVVAARCYDPVTMHELFCPKCAKDLGSSKTALVTIAAPQDDHVVLMNNETDETGKELYTFQATANCTSSSRHLQTDLVLVAELPTRDGVHKVISNSFQTQSKPELHGTPTPHLPTHPRHVYSESNIMNHLPSGLPVVVRVVVSSWSAVFSSETEDFFASKLLEGGAAYHKRMGIIGQRMCLLRTLEVPPNTRIRMWVLVTVYRSLKLAKQGIVWFDGYLKTANPFGMNFLADGRVSCFGVVTSW